MIIGIGTDIIEIRRVENAVNRTNGFLEKAFTEREIEFFKSRNMSPQVIAGNFAAKEAVSKALGTGFRGFSLIDIEITRDELGKPVISLSNKITDRIKEEKYRFNISISHNNSSAIAFVVFEKE